MQTFTQALIEHALSGRVDEEVAANAATNRHDFLVSLEQASKRKRAADAADALAEATPAPAEPAPAAELPTVPMPPEPEQGLGLRIVPAG
jgi:hypothetical protein